GSSGGRPGRIFGRRLLRRHSSMSFFTTHGVISRQAKPARKKESSRSGRNSQLPVLARGAEPAKLIWPSGFFPRQRRAQFRRCCASSRTFDPISTLHSGERGTTDHLCANASTI